MATSISILSVALLLSAAWRDIVTRTIPDRIGLSLAVLGAVGRSLQGMEALFASLAASAAFFAVLVLLHRRGVLGGGDVKLAVALSLGIPPADVWDFIVFTALSGGVLAFTYLLLPCLLPRGAGILPPPLAGSLRRILAVETWRIRRQAPLPYGVAIAAGGAITLFTTIGS